MRSKQLRRGLAVLGIALLALLLMAARALPASAQAKAQASGPQTWTIQVGVDSPDHSITGMAYLTPVIWIDAGDTITWQANSQEPHTVTFLPPGQKMPKFDPNSPVQLSPAGGSSYDGHSFYNSGILSTIPGFGSTSYSLTFPKTGTFVYHCFVHRMMFGVIHVRPAGTPYPFEQEDYNDRAAEYAHDLLSDGQDLREDMLDKSDSHHITVGATDGMAMVMDFIPDVSHIEVGDTITFIDRTPIDDPHTVSFGNPLTPAFPPPPYGNPQDFTGQPLNSGDLGSHTDWVNPTYGNVYRVTFNKAGTYQFFCFIHGGMVVNITVNP
jgi:plastocyanin